MLATRTSEGSGSAVTHTEWGLSTRAIRRATIAFSSPILLAVQKLLAEMVVDRRIGAAPRRSGERDRARSLALAAYQQLRAGREERRLAAADGEHVARGERLAQHADDGGGIMVDRGVDLDLARQHDLLQFARPDPLHRTRDRLLVV